MNWRVQNVELKYRLGELTLGRARLRLAVERRHFAELAPLDGAPAQPPAGAEGWLIPSQPIAASLPALARTGRWLRYVPQQYRRHYIDMGAGFDAYLAKFSSKSRSTLKRKVQKFEQACGGALDWRACRTPEELEAFHRLARELSARTYQERLLAAGLPDTPEFRAGMREAAARDAVRAFLLLREGRPVAYLYCPVVDGVLLYEYLGYDPELAALSPGTVLQWLALRSLFAEGRFRMFDFTEGEGAHKAFFASDHRWCATVYYLPATPVNLARIGLHRGLDRLGDGAGALLERFGLKARVKRWLRRG